MRDKNAKMDRVDLIAEQHLCNSCGACSLICPVNAIRFKETVGGYLFPTVDEDRCIDCGRCADVCPGLHFGKTLMTNCPDDPFVGEFRESFIGRATDNDVFGKSQSGGVVTALLLHALRSGRIDAALVTVMKPGPQPRPVATLATTEEEIIASQKSKYSPVPLLQVLEEVRNRDLGIGFVGLPCHIHGLYNASDLYLPLGGQIRFKIGLVCDRLMTAVAIDYLTDRANVQNEAHLLHFRDKTAGGYPGSVRVLGVAESDAILPASMRLSIKDAFTPARCRLCFDKMNVFADVTVGDPWGISGADMDQGESVVVCRTDAGVALVENALRAGAVVLRPVRYNEIVKGQRIDERRRNWKGYSSAWRYLGFDLPDYWTRVIRNTRPMGNEDYRGNLEHSLSLDKFDSRDELLRYVKSVVLWKKVRQRLLFPYRLAARAIRRARRELSKFAHSPRQQGG